MGLRWFLPEEVIPRELLRHSVVAGLTRSTTTVWALVADEDVRWDPPRRVAGQLGEEDGEITGAEPLIRRGPPVGRRRCVR